ncbi:MAG: RNA polymerase sigma factor [Planctomycetes bacterium]|nr:RNA polymerase sigma factor [Planctomycetota bacterium]
MIDADPQTQGAALPASARATDWGIRLAAVRREVPVVEFARWDALVKDGARSPESLRDALSTRLMEFFRVTQSRAAFGLLYELNSNHLLLQVANCLRRYGSKADPRDVLQEVFFNVYRYPHRFNCEREDAFRVWTAMIVRNTVLKHLRSLSRAGRHEVGFEDLSDQPTRPEATPEHGAIDRESARECGRVYLTYLHLYLEFYSQLSPRERTAIHMVEVEECSYREAASRLGIKLENLKMVIFRARRKIHRSMRRVFEGLPPDCRPARDPRLGARGASAAQRPIAGGAPSDGLADGLADDSAVDSDQEDELDADGESNLGEGAH